MSGPGLSSDELVEDYKSSLDDLVLNSRYEISTLTVIARENIHAAQAIARTLEEHIRNVGALIPMTTAMAMAMGTGLAKLIRLLTYL
jgi:hypothetical protein